MPRLKFHCTGGILKKEVLWILKSSLLTMFLPLHDPNIWLTKDNSGEDGCIRGFSLFHLTLHVLSSELQCQSAWSTTTTTSVWGHNYLYMSPTGLPCHLQRDIQSWVLGPSALQSKGSCPYVLYYSSKVSNTAKLKKKHKTGISPCS